MNRSDAIRNVLIMVSEKDDKHRKAEPDPYSFSPREGAMKNEAKCLSAFYERATPGKIQMAHGFNVNPDGNK